MKRCYACNSGACRCKLCFVACMVMSAVALVALLDGCVVSHEVRARYALEHARCLANERAIVDRPGTSYEQDTDDLEAERLRCDAALDAIEESN